MDLRRIATVLVVALLVAAAAQASVWAKFEEIEGESAIERGEVIELAFRSATKAQPVKLQFDGKTTCPFETWTSVEANTLLLPAVQRAKDFARRSRTSFSFNFEEIVWTVKGRGRGDVQCGPADAKGVASCSGSYAVRSNTRNVRMRGTLHQEYDAFFFDDIIVGIVPHTIAFTYVGHCEAKKR